MKPRSTTPAELRKRAAKQVKAQQAKRWLPPTGSKARLAQELDVHRVELELQNEELRIARVDLEAGLQRYTELFDFAPIGYCSIGPNGHVLQVNHTGAALIDEPRQRIEGRRFALFISPHHRNSFNDLFGRVAVDAPQTGEFELTRTAGAKPVVRVRAARLHGNAPAMLLAFEDISAQKRAEKDLGRVLEELRDADRRKDEFLAVLSHELRTPLSTLLVHGQILQHPGVDLISARRSGEAIERAARTQKRLIDDLLDVSRIIAGKLNMQFDHMEIGPVVRAALDVVASEVASKQIDLRANIDPGVMPLMADGARLQQAIGNLLNNAVKFTPPQGHIRLTVDSFEQQARVRVQDDGSGIHPAFLPHLFERFSQADTTTTRSAGGLGLGLSIVRHIVEAHRGTVRAASAGLGKGSIFTIMLPSVIVAQSKTTVASERAALFNIGGVRLLVVEDDASTRATLTDVLALAGAEVRSADGAAAALDELNHFKPDVLVCDIAMPGEDGCELLRKIRVRRPDQGGTVPALALTAFASDEDRRRTRAAGFQMHVVKPVDVNRLIDAVAELLQRRQWSGAS